ncbi:hypothetical protein [Staphylococcus pasteuri]
MKYPLNLAGIRNIQRFYVDNLNKTDKKIDMEKMISKINNAL